MLTEKRQRRSRRRRRNMAASGDPTAAGVDSKMESTLADGQALVDQGQYAQALRGLLEVSAPAPAQPGICCIRNVRCIFCRTS